MCLGVLRAQLPSNLEQRVVITGPGVLSVISRACADNRADAVDRLLITFMFTILLRHPRDLCPMPIIINTNQRYFL